MSTPTATSIAQRAAGTPFEILYKAQKPKRITPTTKAQPAAGKAKPDQSYRARVLQSLRDEL